MKKNEIKSVAKVMNEMVATSQSPVMVAVAGALKPEEKQDSPTKQEEEAPTETPQEEAKKTKPTAKTTKKKGKVNAEELQIEIDRKTKELQKCLAELEHKKKLSNDRSAFLRAMDDLEKAESKLAEETTFDSAFYRLRFQGAGYGNEEVFTLSNRLVLQGFIDYMKKKITEKISELETLLITE